MTPLERDAPFIGLVVAFLVLGFAIKWFVREHHTYRCPMRSCAGQLIVAETKAELNRKITEHNKVAHDRAAAYPDAARRRMAGRN